MTTTFSQHIKAIKHPLAVRHLRRLLTAPPIWTIDRVSLVDEQMEIRGWALPSGTASGPAAFTVNGRPFAQQQLNLPTPELQKRFWAIAGAGHAGFCCSTPWTPDLVAGAEHLTFDYVERTSLQPYAVGRSFYYPLHCSHRLPSHERRQRVHGNAQEDTFVLTGYSNFLRLREVLRQETGRDFGDATALLDWGCGCGRLGRYLDCFPQLQVTGIDIDADNIAWCREHLPFARYAHIPLHPPTALPAQSFDLLIGISIFTHLTEADQYDWLGELHRLAAPGASLLMTIHGPMAAARSDWKVFRAYRSNSGFLDYGRDLSLDSVIDDKDYYRASFHTHDYIKSRWSEFFEILAIVPAAIGINQDLVVMRRR